MSEANVQLTITVDNKADGQLIEVMAHLIARDAGDRWASLTGWQRDKYRRKARNWSKDHP